MEDIFSDEETITTSPDASRRQSAEQIQKMLLRIPPDFNKAEVHGVSHYHSSSE